MERDTTALYTVLGVEKTASEDEIKKAYRRLALRYHPDKNPGASTEEYIKIVHAYEILSDSRKRAVYDRYGEFGVSALDTPMGQLFDPEIEGMICVFFTVMTLFIAILIIFLSFLSVRIDGIINWRFVIVFIPLWILDFILIMVLVPRTLEVMSSKLDEALDREFPDDDDEEAESEERREQIRANKAARKGAMKIIARARAVLNLTHVLLLIVFQVLIALKADNTMRLTAIEVFIPYFIIEGLHVFSNIGGFILRIIEIRATLGKVSFVMILEALFNNFWFWDIRVAQAVLIALRIDEVIQVSWGIVFIPLYLIGFKYAVQLIFAYRKYSRMEQRELAIQGKAIVTTAGVVFVIIAALMYALIGLIARKLDGYATIPMSSVLIPIFILLSFLMCCVCCCIPLILLGGMNIGNMNDDAEDSLVNPDRRITADIGESSRS